jgi:hypothetical protein
MYIAAQSTGIILDTSTAQGAALPYIRHRALFSARHLTKKADDARKP